MRLFTIQRPSVWESLESSGVHRANSAIVESSSLLAPEVPVEEDHTMTAYRWLSQQMISRVGHPPAGVRYPVWLWTKKPDLRTGGYGMPGDELVMIEVEVPEKSVILTDFMLWSFPYGGWAVPHPYKDYLKFRRDLKEAGLDEYGMKRLPRRFHSRVEKSWDLVFDLDCSNRSLTSAGPDKIIQACVWEIRLDQVVGKRKFKCR